MIVSALKSIAKISLCSLAAGMILIALSVDYVMWAHSIGIMWKGAFG